MLNYFSMLLIFRVLISETQSQHLTNNGVNGQYSPISNNYGNNSNNSINGCNDDRSRYSNNNNNTNNHNHGGNYGGDYNKIQQSLR